MRLHVFRALSWLGALLASTAAVPAGAATLADLVAQALDRNPSIPAARARVRAAREATAPAGAWPDPLVSLSVMNVGATSWTVGRMDMAQASVGIAQEIPIRGKLGLMHASAEADLAQADAAFAETQNRIAAEVARAALDVYELDRTLQIEREIRDRYEGTVSAAEGQLAVGATMQQDVVGMMLDVDMSNATIAEATERRFALVAKLNGLLDRPANTPFDSLSVAPPPATPADTSALAASALAERPELLRMRAALARAEAMSDLKERQRVPDPMVMARYGNRGTMDGVYEVGVSFLLPVRMDRRQNAEVRQAEAMREMSRREVEAMEVETAAMVGSLVARLNANGRLLAAYSQTLLPRATQVVEATLASYNVGRTTLIMVLDSVRKLYRLRKEALMVELMQRRMFVELEQTLGHATEIATAQATYVR